MERRKFMKQGFVAGGTLLSSALLLGEQSRGQGQQKGPVEKPFNLAYGIHDGMFRTMAGPDFTDQLKFAHEMGFRAMEDNGMMERSADMQQKIGETMSRLGMQMGVFVLAKGGNGAHSIAAGKPEFDEIFLNACRDSVDVAKRVHATWMTVVPGDFARGLPMGIQTANVIRVLRKASEILEPHKIVMVLEPLSDTPDLFLRHSDQTYMICKAVNSPSCKILFDMFHMQRNEGNIIHNIDLVWDEIGYFQIGNNPGRNEPGTGEMDYKNIFKHIFHKGYSGVLGMEHGNARPGKEGEMALIKAYRDADNFDMG